MNDTSQPAAGTAPAGEIVVRDARADDFAAIQAIYAHHVLHGLASFEETPPELNEMQRRFEEVTGRGLPYLVAVSGDTVLGYGYCSTYRPRSAYRYAIEDSVYIHPSRVRRGIGHALLGVLVERATALEYRQMIAVIGDSAHLPSIALHAAHGFLRVGTLRSVGFKLGRWVDTVIMQRALGPGDGRAPPTR